MKNNIRAKFAFKNDRFKKNRGGRSVWLLLICKKCKNNLFIYQKDGPGILKRLYCDRIILPKKIEEKKNLKCKKCETVLGISMVYQKEDRLAYRLFAGAVGKKIIKGNKFSI